MNTTTRFPLALAAILSSFCAAAIEIAEPHNVPRLFDPYSMNSAKWTAERRPELKDLLAKQPPAPIADIKAKQEALMKAMEPVAQEMYASAQAAQGAAGAQPGANPGAGTPPPNNEPKKETGGDDVVDADFTMK